SGSGRRRSRAPSFRHPPGPGARSARRPRSTSPPPRALWCEPPRSPPTLPVRDRSGRPRRCDPIGPIGRISRHQSRVQRVEIELMASEVSRAEIGFGLADLFDLRRLVASTARDAGLSSSRAEELALAANEIATNAVLHGRPPATLRIWL